MGGSLYGLEIRKVPIPLEAILSQSGIQTSVAGRGSCRARNETALFGKLHVSGIYREAERRHPNDGFDVYEWACDPFGPWGLDNAYLEPVPVVETIDF